MAEMTPFPDLTRDHEKVIETVLQLPSGAWLIVREYERRFTYELLA